MLHVGKGEFRIGHQFKDGGEPIIGLKSGLHTHKALDHFLKMCNFEKSKCELKVLKNGVTRVILPEEYFVSGKKWESSTNGFGLSGAKTLWPKHYTVKDILLAGQDILSQGKNVISKKGRVFQSLFEGVTLDEHIGLEIKARVRIKPNGKIKTCYPEWYQ